jgi:hypothetical protein
MSAIATGPAGEVQSLRYQARMVEGVIRRNVEGISHQESLVQPLPGGNCLNWIMGHLVWAYTGALPLVGQKPMMEPARLSQYARGAEPLTDPARAVDFTELLEAWGEGTRRMDAGLADVQAETLGQPVPASPTGNPDETIGSLLATILFHQAYHSGQTAVLRRLVGKPGAIK